MNNLVTTSAIESALMNGDISRLSSDQRVSYYKQVCDSLGLSMLTKPFEFINLNGKLTFYARKDATDQLRKIHGVAITKMEINKVDDIYTVTAYAKDRYGKEDTDIGSVNVAGLKGENLANAMMKASTKAKRRVTLSICGLGILDETEIADIPREAKTPDFNSDPFEKQAVQIDSAKAPEIPPSLQNDEPEDLGSFFVRVGKFSGKKLSDVDPFDLDGYVKYIKKTYVKIDGPMKDLVEASEAYLSSIEVPQK